MNQTNMIYFAGGGKKIVQAGDGTKLLGKHKIAMWLYNLSLGGLFFLSQPSQLLNQLKSCRLNSPSNSASSNSLFHPLPAPLYPLLLQIIVSLCVYSSSNAIPLFLFFSFSFFTLHRLLTGFLFVCRKGALSASNHFSKDGSFGGITGFIKSNILLYILITALGQLLLHKTTISLKLAGSL